MNNDTLQQLVIEAYALFSHYKITNREIAVCNCGYCFPDSEIDIILNTNLRDLSRYTIYQYLDSINSKNEILLVNQIRYLLPRILELLVKGQHIRHSVEYTLDALHCENHLWQPQEINFLHLFAEVYLLNIKNRIKHDVIFSEFEDHWLSENLVMFHLAGLNTDKLLNILTENIDDYTILRGIIFIINFDLENGKYEGTLASIDFCNKIDAWLKTPLVKNKLIQTVLTYIDDDNLNDATRYYLDVVFDLLTSFNE